MSEEARSFDELLEAADGTALLAGRMLYELTTLGHFVPLKDMNEAAMRTLEWITERRRVSPNDHQGHTHER